MGHLSWGTKHVKLQLVSIWADVTIHEPAALSWKLEAGPRCTGPWSKVAPSSYPSSDDIVCTSAFRFLELYCLLSCENAFSARTWEDKHVAAMCKRASMKWYISRLLSSKGKLARGHYTLLVAASKKQKQELLGTWEYQQPHTNFEYQQLHTSFRVPRSEHRLLNTISCVPTLDYQQLSTNFRAPAIEYEYFQFERRLANGVESLNTISSLWQEPKTKHFIYTYIYLYIHIYDSLLGPGPGPTCPVKDISLRAPVCTLSFPHYPLEARSCKLLSSRAWTTSAYFSGVSKSAAREGISWHSWWHRATMSPTWDLFSFCWKLNFSLSAWSKQAEAF